MKRLFLLGFACFVLAPAAALADDKSNDKQVEWEILFDGTNLDAFDLTSVKDAWVITDKGELHAPSGSPTIYTKQRYTDFVLELDFRMKPKAQANSGVFLRVHDKEDEVQTGMEVQILDNPEYDVPFDASNACGALYGLVHPKVDANKPVGDWNHYRIVVDGSKVIVELNDVEVVRADLSKFSKWAKAGRNSGAEPSTFAYVREGFIGLQNYGPTVWFRNIKLQRLSARKPKYTGDEPIDQVLGQ